MSGGRQRGPDQLRGLLLTLVIFGHTYSAATGRDHSKWIIYGFHMPLFFAVSGWLLSSRSLTGRTLPDLLGYYWRRMLWQWLAVSVAFGLWKGALPASLKGTVDVLFFNPLFHLWFIPALLIMVVVTQVVLRAGCGWLTLGGIALLSFALFELPVGKPYIPASLSSIDHRYGAYFIWFFLGFAVRNAGWAWLEARAVRYLAAGVAVTGLAVYIAAFSTNKWQHDLSFAAFNTGLIMLLPLMISTLNRPLPLIGDAMTKVGRASLWIYLLHPFVTELWRPHDDGSLTGRLMGALVTAAILGLSLAVLHLLALARAASTTSTPGTTRPAGPGRHAAPAAEPPAPAAPPVPAAPPAPSRIAELAPAAVREPLDLDLDLDQPARRSPAVFTVEEPVAPTRQPL